MHYGNTLGFLATFSLDELCQSTATSITCDTTRLGQLGPDDAFVMIYTGGYGPPPTRTYSDVPGEPVTIDGRGARKAVEKPGCHANGGEETVGYTIDNHQPQGYLVIHACLRGPNLVHLEQQVEDMIRSARVVDDPTAF